MCAEVTFETKVKEPEAYPVLDAVGELYGRALRSLFVDLYVRGGDLNSLKREYLRQFGLTARQFNSIVVELRGRVEAVKAAAERRVKSLGLRIKAAEEKIAVLERTIAGAGRKKRHHKRRRLGILKDRLALAEKEAERPIPGICFGGRRLFRRQFHLKENGYLSHEEWLKDWRDARSNRFFCVGSRGETGGNQTATLFSNPDGSFDLRLRIPPALEEKFGKYLWLRGLRFPYGQEVIHRALVTGQAVSVRLIRKRRGKKIAWYVQVATGRPEVEIITRRENGCLGVDLNPNLIALGLVDRHGNPVHTEHIHVQVQGRRKGLQPAKPAAPPEAAAALGDAAAKIVGLAKSLGVPIAVERLDFQEKKDRLEVLGGKAYARKLSSFAYSLFFKLLCARAYREGVEVIPVNPAFTTIIGFAKFGTGYGLSPHSSAAVAIARRGLGCGERPRARLSSALPLPVRNRGRHVWGDWGRLSRWLRRRGGIHAVLRGRCPSEGSPGGGDPLSVTANSRHVMDARVPGCDPQLQPPAGAPPKAAAGNAVRPAAWSGNK